MAEKVMDALKNHVNDMINTHRRLLAMLDDPGQAANHPALKELVTRLDTQMEASRERLKEAGFEEPDLGQPEPGTPTDPQANTRTPANVLSSPYAGEEPRYVAQHRHTEPDPIAKVAPTPPSEPAGRTDDNDPRSVHIHAKSAADARPDKAKK